MNDAELFDLSSDPGETRNVAARKGANEALVLAMNTKLDAAIQAEIGKDDGREMPEVAGVDGSFDRADL